MKKLFFIFIIIFFYTTSFTTEPDIGPVEFEENINSVCTKACKRQKLAWTGKTTCNYQNLSKQNFCKCECK